MNRKNHALTIMELIVSLSILLVITVILAMFLNQARTSSEGGMARLEARSLHRQAQGRLRLVLRSAIPPNEVEPALVWPELGNSDMSLRFFAPANLIDDTVVFDPRTPDYPEFTISFDPTSSGILLQRSDGTGPSQQIGRNFSSVIFNRDQDRSIQILLESEGSIRGASGSTKVVQETSTSRVIIHSKS